MSTGEGHNVTCRGKRKVQKSIKRRSEEMKYALTEWRNKGKTIRLEGLATFASLISLSLYDS